MTFVARWTAVAPCALGGALAAHVLYKALTWLSLLFVGFIDPNFFLIRLHVETVSNFLTGGAFVYCGARVAPVRRRYTAFALAASGFLIVGFLLFPAVHSADPWNLWGFVCTAVGIGAATFYFYRSPDD